MESLSNVLARQPMMEVFQEVEFAALRIWKSGSYLHADEERSVYIGSLPRAGDSRHSAVWAVEPPIDAAAPQPQYVRLRGAYGRYLGAPDSYGCPLPFLSVDAAQRDHDRVEIDAIMWQPVACSGSDVVCGRDARGVVLLRDRYGRYLRGNKTLLASRRSVPVKPYVDERRYVSVGGGARPPESRQAGASDRPLSPASSQRASHRCCGGSSSWAKPTSTTSARDKSGLRLRTEGGQ